MSDCAARNCLITAPSLRPPLGDAVFGGAVLDEASLRDLPAFGFFAASGASAVSIMKPDIAFWKDRVAVAILAGRISLLIRRMLAVRVLDMDIPLEKQASTPN
jgi:hypothetical protein